MSAQAPDRRICPQLGVRCALFGRVLSALGLVVLGACGSGPQQKTTDAPACSDAAVSSPDGFDANGWWELDPVLTTSDWDLRVALGVTAEDPHLWSVAYEIDVSGAEVGPSSPGYLAMRYLHQYFDTVWADVYDGYFYVRDEKGYFPSPVGAYWSGSDSGSTLVLLRDLEYYPADESVYLQRHELWCRPQGADRMQCAWAPSIGTRYPPPIGEQSLVRRPAGWTPRPLSDAKGLETVLLASKLIGPARLSAEPCPDPAEFSTEADCAVYAAALAPCLEAAGVDLSAVDLADNQCNDHADLALGWFFDCAADVLSTADCSTREGFVDAGDAVRSCALLAPDPS
jgi:hypothetical protein